jgi:benzylsuccinate CoA-transferase BbsF subunit
MVSMSAAGQDGPYRDLMGYGPSINSISGVDSLVGYAGDDRLMVNFWDADPTTAVTAAFAVLSALHYRERTGKGQHIDLAFYEALASLVGEGIMDYSMNKRVAQPQGNRHPAMSPHGIYPCAGKDRWLSIAVKTQEDWQGLCRAMGDPPWTRDERFADLFGRLKNRETLDELVALWTRQHPSYEAMRLLQGHGVAAAVVATLEDVYLDPHDQYRRTSVKIEDARLARQDVLYGIPWRLSDTPGAIHKLASPMGTDNERIFCGMLGMPPDEMQRLTDEQVIY